MQKKIFFDANIVIDLINAGNDLNYPVSWMFSELANRRDILLCSPISFAITYYFLGKKIRDKKVLNEKIRKVFSYFFFTQENAVTMEKVMYSFFTDLEDAIQYYSALDTDADVIITKNHFDFYLSAIPVYHPTEYISNFYYKFTTIGCCN